VGGEAADSLHAFDHGHAERGRVTPPDDLEIETVRNRELSRLGACLTKGLAVVPRPVMRAEVKAGCMVSAARFSKSVFYLCRGKKTLLWRTRRGRHKLLFLADLGTQGSRTEAA